MFPAQTALDEDNRKKNDFEESRDKIEKALEELAEAGRRLSGRIDSFLIPETPSKEEIGLKEVGCKSIFKGFIDTTHQKIKAMTVYLNLLTERVSL